MDAVVVYGAGGYGRWVADVLRSASVDVLAVVDRSANGVLRPDEGARLFAGAPVVLGVFSPGPDVHEIAAQMTALGFGAVISPPETFAWLAEQGRSESRYWLTTDLDLYDRCASEIEHARGLLADDESRELLDRELAYRLGAGVTASPAPLPLAEQHTGALPTEAGVVVDCGAYTGDTLPNWSAVGLPHSTVVALEPHPDSYAELVRTAAESPLDVIPLHVGVSEFASRLAIIGSGPAAQLVDSPDGDVEVVRLDDLLVGARTSLVKMDIEGAEAGALRGGLQVLRRDRPHLSISVYHKPHHLWSILGWLDAEVGGYEFRLRVYGHQGYDTILYATPAR